MAKKEQNNKKALKPAGDQGSKLEVKEKKEKAVKPVKNAAKAVTEVHASLRHLRIAPLKMRLVINLIRGKNAMEAVDRLRLINKAGANPVSRLINSALANAVNNFSLDKNDLYIKKIIVNESPILRRWQPRAHGRSAPIRKRGSHVELILGFKPGMESTSVKKTAATKSQKEEVKVVNPSEVKRSAPKVAGQNSGDKSHDESGFINKIFNRKTG